MFMMLIMYQICTRLGKYICDSLFLSIHLSMISQRSFQSDYTCPYTLLLLCLHKERSNEFYIINDYNIICYIALAGVAQCTEHPPVNRKVASSIPFQGTCLGCRSRLQLAAQEATDRCFSPSLSLPSPLYIKILFGQYLMKYGRVILPIC